MSNAYSDINVNLNNIDISIGINIFNYFTKKCDFYMRAIYCVNIMFNIFHNPVKIFLLLNLPMISCVLIDRYCSNKIFENKLIKCTFKKLSQVRCN